MYIIFGVADCSFCESKKRDFEEKGLVYKYYDLDTAEGLSKAAFYGIDFDASLPIVIDDTDPKYVN